MTTNVRGGYATRITRRAIIGATQNRRLATFVQRYGLRLGAGRFVAGTTLDECVALLRRLEAEGMRTYAIVLGESVTSRSDVERSVAEHVALVERLEHEGLPSTVSLKLTSMGLAIDEELAYANAARIVALAAAQGRFARIDMENAVWVDATLRTYRRLRAAGHDNVGVVLQAYLYRTAGDLRELAPLRPNVRLVKGAYAEPASVAHPQKRDVDRSYAELLALALDTCSFVAIATHDEAMLAEAGRLLRREGAAPHEFQMLLGVRHDRQRSLAETGEPVRVCVPFGGEWYVYLGRRLAERPANLWFLLRNLVR